MKTEDKELVTIDCLKHSIEDTQQTIRGYDIKAEILAILLTFAIGLTNFTLLPHLNTPSKLILLCSWVVSLSAIALLGLVLHPKVNQFKSITLGTYSPSGTYFLHKVTESAQNTVSDLAIRARNTNWIEELMYESMKLSLIREKKHSWFIIALRLSGITLFLIFLVILIGACYGFSTKLH